MRLLLAAALLALGFGQAQADDETLEKPIDVKVCRAEGPAITLTASPKETSLGGTVTLSWTVDGGLPPYTVTDAGQVNGTSVRVKPASDGAKTYTVSALDGCGKQGSASVTIKVVRRRVFLSGSRYYTPPNVGHYMLTYTVDPNFGSAEGASVHRFVDSRADAASRQRFDEFAGAMKSWPPSAQAYQTHHTAGRTYIVDESGKVLGDLDTWGLWANGMPGLNYLGNPWGNGDYNKVFVGNGSLNYGGVDYDVVGFVSVSPIILDLDGDDKPDVDQGRWLPHPTRFNRSRTVMFDINADGFPDITEWIGPKDGLLVAPLAKGSAVKGEHLFGNPIGFIDGYQKLGLRFDRDDSGAIEGAELEGLLVWQDTDTDGRAQPAELKSLASIGVTSISTTHRDLKSNFTVNGKERSTWDWWPTCMLVYPKPLAKNAGGGAPKL